MAQAMERRARRRTDYKAVWVNGTPYNGIIVLMLWASAVERGFAAQIWMTFKQAKELGGHVCKGEKGSLVVYTNTIIRTIEAGPFEVRGFKIWFWKQSAGSIPATRTTLRPYGLRVAFASEPDAHTGQRPERKNPSGGGILG